MIWGNEERNYPDAIKVIVLEDAERLLLDRENAFDSQTSSLLNLTDGFIGDLTHVHLICTINSELTNVDEALMRPGRQKFFRQFEKLAYREAAQLARHLNIAVPNEDRDYTLAEIYHLKDTQRAGEHLLEKKRPQLDFNFLNGI